MNFISIPYNGTHRTRAPLLLSDDTCALPGKFQAIVSRVKVRDSIAVPTRDFPALMCTLERCIAEKATDQGIVKSMLE